jgi:peptidoglycan L-alanyl-D-glutamate endopeptidase CwlK
VDPDRSVADLEDHMEAKVQFWILECKEAGYTVVILETQRSFDRQNQLYAQGRTAPGPKVTNAKGGDSPHNVRRGLDYAVLINGRVSQDVISLAKCAALAKGHGMEWGGDWPASTGFVDNDHLQYFFCDLHNERHPGAHYFNEDGSCKV